jgi:hypothetical protein
MSLNSSHCVLINFINFLFQDSYSVVKLLVTAVFLIYGSILSVFDLSIEKHNSSLKLGITSLESLLPFNSVDVPVDIIYNKFLQYFLQRRGNIMPRFRIVFH